MAVNTLNKYASLMCTCIGWYQTHPRPVHRNLQKGMGCQVKWYPCQYSGVDPEIEESGGHRVDIGVSVYNSQYSRGSGGTLPQDNLFNLDLLRVPLRPP